MRARILLTVLILTGASTQVRADEKPVDRATMDQRVVNAAYEAAFLGTEIFNKGNHEGCYRLYQGTLMALVPMLESRANLQTKVKMRLERATKMKAADAAFELRTALDEIQNDIAPPKKSTLWERLGGESGVRKVVVDFTLMALEDKKVNFLRNGKYQLDGKGAQHLQQLIVEWISSKAGGPLAYTGRSMAESHKGMGITDAEFDALVADMVTVLKKYKVSDADIKTLGEAVEATRKDIVEKVEKK
jgi:hemoglobin